MYTKEQINELIPYLSASKIHAYFQCPNSFFLKYVDQLADAETNDSYAKYGTMLHNIYENIANRKYETVEQPIEEYKEQYGSCGLTEEQFEKYYECGLQSILNKWEFLHSVEIVQAEAKFSTKPLENVPKYFGFIDLVYRNENGKLIVRDYKTSKKYTKSQLAKNIQAYFYAEACLALYGELPLYFEFDFVRFGESTIIMIDENFMKFNRMRVEGIWKQIEMGIRTGKWTGFYCENFCEGRNNCPLYQERMKNKRVKG